MSPRYPVQYRAGLFMHRQNGNSEMRVFAADTGAVAVGFPDRAASACMLMAEDDVLVHIIANSLDPSPARRRRSEQRPSDFGKTLGFAITSAEKKNHRVVRKILDGVLLCIGKNRLRLTLVVDNASGREANLPGRSNKCDCINCRSHRDSRGSIRAHIRSPLGCQLICTSIRKFPK